MASLGAREAMSVFKVGQMWRNRAGAVVEIVELHPIRCVVRRRALDGLETDSGASYMVMSNGRYGGHRELDLLAPIRTQGDDSNVACA